MISCQAILCCEWCVLKLVVCYCYWTYLEPCSTDSLYASHMRAVSLLLSVIQFLSRSDGWSKFSSICWFMNWFSSYHHRIVPKVTNPCDLLSLEGGDGYLCIQTSLSIQMDLVKWLLFSSKTEVFLFWFVKLIYHSYRCRIWYARQANLSYLVSITNWFGRSNHLFM